MKIGTYETTKSLDGFKKTLGNCSRSHHLARKEGLIDDNTVKKQCGYFKDLSGKKHMGGFHEGVRIHTLGGRGSTVPKGLYGVVMSSKDDMVEVKFHSNFGGHDVEMVPKHALNIVDTEIEKREGIMNPMSSAIATTTRVVGLSSADYLRGDPLITCGDTGSMWRTSASYDKCRFNPAGLIFGTPSHSHKNRG